MRFISNGVFLGLFFLSVAANASELRIAKGEASQIGSTDVEPQIRAAKAKAMESLPKTPLRQISPWMISSGVTPPSGSSRPHPYVWAQVAASFVDPQMPRPWQISLQADEVVSTIEEIPKAVDAMKRTLRSSARTYCDSNVTEPNNWSTKDEFKGNHYEVSVIGRFQCEESENLDETLN